MATNTDTNAITHEDKATDDYLQSVTTRRQITPLLARRRENLDRDRHITEYDYLNESGRKSEKVVQPGPDGTTEKREVDLIALLGAAPSTTASIQLLKTEARLAEQGRPIENPHIPANDDVLHAALNHLAPDNFTPAWGVIDGSELLYR